MEGHGGVASQACDKAPAGSLPSERVGGGGGGGFAGGLLTLPPGPGSAWVSAWEVFENHDAFPGDHALTKAFTSAEDAMKLCAKHSYSGFVVFQTGGSAMAHFRRQHRTELREKKIRCPTPTPTPPAAPGLTTSMRPR